MPTSTIRRVALLGGMLVVVMLLAACNGDGDDNGTPAAPADPAGDGERIESPIAGFQLESLTVQVGDTVVWRNEDSTPHTSTGAGGEWDSGSMPAGATFEHTFTDAGTFDYFCALHPTMTGTITVE